MTRKNPDPCSPAAWKASDKKAASFAKKNFKKMVNSSAPKTRSSKKDKQADADAAVLLVGLAAATLLYNAVSGVVEKVKGK